MRGPAFSHVTFLAFLALAACGLVRASDACAQGRRIQTPFPQPAPKQPALPQLMKLRVEEDLITGELRNVPLQTALEELASRTGIVFEVALQEDDPVSVSFFRIPLQEAVQRLAGPGNSITYYAGTETGQNRIQLVRVLTRTPKSSQASLRYIGTGAVTKTGEDAIDSPEQAMKALTESTSLEVRQKAVEVLVAAKGEVAVQALTKVVEDEAPEMRVAAIEGLASLSARGALPQIVQHLRDKHPAVRQSAIVAVALLGDAENVKDLKPLSRDKDASVAAAADIAIKKLSVRRP